MYARATDGVASQTSCGNGGAGVIALMYQTRKRGASYYFRERLPCLVVSQAEFGLLLERR